MGIIVKENQKNSRMSNLKISNDILERAIITDCRGSISTLEDTSKEKETTNGT